MCNKFSAPRLPSATRADRALASEIRHDGEVNADDLLALHGVGPKAIRILSEVLNERGKALG